MTDIMRNMSESEKVIYEKHRRNFPFPVVQFANDIGVKVFAEDLPASVSGAITKKDSEYHILVNSNHHENRMRFTLAHELAHYFNDKDYLDSAGEIKDESKQAKKWMFRDEQCSSDPDMYARDVKANRFAADLLMPQQEFIHKWKELRTPEDVAEYFKVSPDAVRVRAAVLLGEIV